MVGRAVGASLILFASGLAAATPHIELAWPTPNPAYFEGKPIDAYVQATASGEAESGLFGCARSGGGQFHEGVDLKPVSRNRQGEPTDPIFAALPGVVRYINARVGESNYGRYIVLEHPDMHPPVYTLYAHLSSTAPGLKIGDTVTTGQVIAIMGHTADHGGFPKERAHLHFEIGLMVTREFQSWYDWKQFGSANVHGLYNGMNLMGVDALDVYNQFRARRVDDFQGYFAQLPAVARVRIATRKVPDFVQRYPELLTKEIPASGVAGWEVKVNWTGLPFSWTPLGAMEVIGYRPDEVRLLEVDAAALRKTRCKAIAVTRHGATVPGKDLETVLQLLFGLR
ncbi:MAG: M23 family metallopeptidase [Verrucomicrobia bacterium]|nr:M23 family metallopeptidase [Verrucomicrobiota bacterium]